MELYYIRNLTLQGVTCCHSDFYVDRYIGFPQSYIIQVFGQIWVWLELFSKMSEKSYTYQELSRLNEELALGKIFHWAFKNASARYRGFSYSAIFRDCRKKPCTGKNRIIGEYYTFVSRTAKSNHVRENSL